MTLYELTEKQITLLQMMEQPDADKEEIQFLIDTMDEKLEDKADGYAVMHKTLTSEIKMVDEEIKRLNALKQSLKDNDKRMMDSLKTSLMAVGKTSFKTKLHSFQVRNCSETLVIDDSESVPAEYLIKQPDKINNKKLKEFLQKNGDEDCEYAHLEKATSLVVS